MKAKIRNSTALTILLSAGALYAQYAQAADDSSTQLESVIVTGTRTTGLKVEDSASPIQVLDAGTLTTTGEPDLAQALSVVVPSFEVEAQGQDTAALTLAARLRGLSPNDTLVLINGKRRHGTANLTVDTGSPYIGSAAPDLSLIPQAAISRIEVLTDGAAAQYGTDAIAGVVNIILKRDDHGGTVNTEAGGYFDGRGRTGDVSGNFGFKPWDGAFINLTVESKYHGYSSRGATDPRVVDPANLRSQPGILNQDKWPYTNQIDGDAAIRNNTILVNSGWDISDDVSFYSFATFSHKVGLSYENYRLPSKIPQVYPNGFNPSEGISEDDGALTLGLKGTAFTWDWDLSTTYGKDIDSVGTYNTASPDYYAAFGYTPKNFYDGAFKASQWTDTLDFSRNFAVGWATPLNVAFGLEHRLDGYEIDAGSAAARFSSGPSSYPGFNLTDAGSHDRRNDAIYLDLAGNPIKPWTVDVAARSEHYSDFGNATVGKLTSRYDFNETVGLRGTLSTGFRAPTLAEEYYSATNVGPSTAFVQLPPNSVGASLIGINGLKPEKSDNISLGLVIKPTEKSSVSLDIYQIKIRDRIVGSGNVYGSFNGVIQSTAVNAAIAANGNVLDQAVLNSPIGQTGINVFTNAADTKTEGAEFVATLASNYGSLGRVDWSASGAYNKTTVTKLNQVPSQLGNVALLDQNALSILTTASPRIRVNVAGLWKKDNWTVNVRENYYGVASDYEIGDDGNYYKNTIDPKFITSVAVGNQVTKAWTVTVGANNLFNQYPDKKNPALLNNLRANGDNGAVTQYANWAPFGINGGFYYARATYQF